MSECDAAPTGDFEQVRGRELDWLQHEEGRGEPLAALCLSGGGIRSATFCLGVLQGLAEKGELGRFHYLSTVSGGGYIGSWLTAWIKREGQEKVLQQLAQVAPGPREPKPVRHLREYTNYLSPVWGLSADLLALVATSVRNLAVNWAVMVPLLLAVLLLPRLQLALVAGAMPAPGIVFYAAAAAAVLCIVLALAYVVADLPGSRPGREVTDRFVPLCFVPMLAAAFLLAALAPWAPGAAADLQQALPAVGGSTGDRLLDATRDHGQALSALAGFLLYAVAVPIGLVWRRGRGLERRPFHVSELLLIGLSGCFGGAAVWQVGSLASRPDFDPVLFAVAGPPLLLLAFWAATVLYAAGGARVKSEDDREWWARAAAWWLGAAVVWVLLSVLVLYVPRWILSMDWLQQVSGPPVAGTAAALLGVVTAAAGYWSSNGAKLKEQAQGVLEGIGLKVLDAAAIAFVVALAIGLSIVTSHALQRLQDLDAAVAAAQRDPALMKQGGWNPDKQREAAGGAQSTKGVKPADALRQRPPSLAAREHVAYGVVQQFSAPDIVARTALGLVCFALLVSFLTGINTFSLHSMYGNRLARAYLGASNPSRRAHPFTGFDPADNPRMARDEAFPHDRQGGGRRLFHVVNAALNLVDAAGSRKEWQQRKADSFTMSPLHCGARSLGYVPTQAYGGTQGLSMARAMAISGAAASPNMGYHTSPPVAFVMTFLNVRLGWWCPNPRPEHRRNWFRHEPELGLQALLHEARAATRGDSPFVYLSDGGHFDNLGLYEMVRRRCGRIVVVDAGCDPDHAFRDLNETLRKIRVDTGVRIRFSDPLPTPASVQGSGRVHAVGVIGYREAGLAEQDGEILYLKPVLSGDEPLDVASYAKANAQPGRQFPHQPTSDQFFDESQFESYRVLGLHLARKAFAGDAREPAPALPLAARRLRSGRHAPARCAPAGGSALVRSAPGTTRPAADAAPAGAGGGEFLSKLREGLSAAGGRAAVAGAITAGGVLGVTGSVALQSGAEVVLKPDSAHVQLVPDSAKVQLAPGAMVRVEGAMLPPAPPAELLLAQLQLAEIGQQLKSMAGATQQREKSLAVQNERLQALAVSIELLAKVRPAGPDSAAQTALAQALENELQQVRLAYQAALEGLVNKLAGELGNVDRSVSEQGPRRNIRGVAEGVAK